MPHQKHCKLILNWSLKEIKKDLDRVKGKRKKLTKSGIPAENDCILELDQERKTIELDRAKHQDVVAERRIAREEAAKRFKTFNDERLAAWETFKKDVLLDLDESIEALKDLYRYEPTDH